jgi:nitrile hydratase beta subunit
MKLQHFLGGLEGLGPAAFERRVFVAPWERRIFGIHVAMMALSNHLPAARETPTAFRSEWTWADLRKGAEAMNPLDYFKYRYYEKWLGGISSFFVRSGYISQEELEARAARALAAPGAPAPGGPPDIDRQVRAYLEQGDSPLRPAPGAPRFATGDAVRVKDVPLGAHSRLPGYLRNQSGVVETVYDGAYSYFCSTGPDGLGEPMPAYCVRFDPQQIWDGRSEPGTVIYADLFEAYLEPA